MGFGGVVSRSIHCHKTSLVLALVSLVALSGLFTISDSARNDKGIKPEILSNLGNTTSFTRKLLLSNDHDKDMDRVGQHSCFDNIIINQGPGKPIPSGIPSYVVEILNVCTTGCSISNIRLSCGWFSSATMINPKIFRRVKYNECLVNDGGPLRSGDVVSFHYANTYPYPLSVSSLNCNP